jgi:hypothetical protein
MKIAIMQPYFLPYIGYYQLYAAVDNFIIYDDVQFTKKGWINRNYLDSPDGPWLFSIPITSGPVSDLIRDKVIAPNFSRSALKSRIKQNYSKYDYTEQLEIIGKIVDFETTSLFEYLHASLRTLTDALGLGAEKIMISSDIGDFRRFKGQDKVLAICREMDATTYINPIGGRDLYDATVFEANGLDLAFMPKQHSNLEVTGSKESSFSIAHEFLTQEIEVLRGKLLRP